MKKIIFFIMVIFAGYACHEDTANYNLYTCTYASFSFINDQGKDIFMDSTQYTIEDFEVSNVNGLSYIIDYQITGDSLYSFNININRLKEDTITVLFHFKEDTDTITATIPAPQYGDFIRELYYNENLIQENKSANCGGYHIITK